MLPCSNQTSGIAKLSLGLLIMKGKGKLLPGTPLRFTLKKECSVRGKNSSLDFSSPSQGSVLISAYSILSKHFIFLTRSNMKALRATESSHGAAKICCNI